METRKDTGKLHFEHIVAEAESDQFETWLTVSMSDLPIDTLSGHGRFPAPPFRMF